MITRIILNGFATYARLATTFAFGLFFTSYVTAKLGLEGFGLVSLAAGTFGISFAIESGIGHAVSRELAPAFAKRDPKEIKAAFSSTFTASCFFGLFGGLVSIVLAYLATKGVIRIPGERMEFIRGLVWLLLSEGAIGVVRSVLSVWHRSAFASRLIWLDSIYLIIERFGKPLVAYIVLDSAASTAEGLDLIPQLAVGNFIWISASLVLSSLISLLLVKQARVLPRWTDFATLRGVLRRIFEALQFAFLSGFTPQLLALVVNATVGLAYNGIWSVVVQVGGWCTLLGEGILRGIDPLMVHLRVEKGEAQVQSALAILSKVQAYAFILVGVLVLSACPKLINLWVGRSWEADEALASLGMTAEQAVEMASFLIFLQLLALLPRMIFSPLERTLFGFGHMKRYLTQVWLASVVALVISAPAMQVSGWLGWAPLAVLAANLCTYVIGVYRSSAAIMLGESRFEASEVAKKPLVSLLLTWPVAPGLWSWGADFTPVQTLVCVGFHVMYSLIIILILERSLLGELVGRVRSRAV